jgi:hypothetical protein
MEPPKPPDETPPFVPVSAADPADLIDPFSLPVELNPDPAPKPLNKRLIVLMLMSALVAFGFVFLATVLGPHDVSAHRSAHLAHHRGIGDNEREVPADGTISVNNGAATMTYTVLPKEFETTDKESTDLFYDDTLYRELSTLNKWHRFGRDLIQLDYVKLKENLDDPKTFALWLNNRNVGEWEDSEQVTEPKKTELAGHTAYTWEYVTPDDGWWVYTVRVPQGKETYNPSCRLMPEADTPQARARCKQVISTLKIKRASK